MYLNRMGGIRARIKIPIFSKKKINFLGFFFINKNVNIEHLLCVFLR